MDDKKIHEQSLALAKQLIEKDPSLRDWVVSKFPELRESEDERIRMWLIDCVKAKHDCYFETVTREQVLAYLEKQKEEEGYEAIPIESTLEYKAGKHAGFLEGLNEGRKQKESLRDFIDNFPYSDEQKEQKPANNYLEWRNIVYYVLKEWLGIGQYMDMAPFNDIVKTLQEKYSLPKPAEWSGEDELMRTVVIQTLETLGGRGTTGMQIDWLKSLRPSWKPSVWQMTMLRAVINDPNNAGAESCQLALTDLYEQLKKL